jgi:hypothetical protein
MPQDDLLYLAQLVARSRFRLEKLLECETPDTNLVLCREEKMLAEREARLKLLVDAARVAGDLPPKSDLLGSLGRFAGEMTKEHAEGAVAAAVLLEAAYPDKPEPVQPHHSITAQPVRRFQVGQ